MSSLSLQSQVKPGTSLRSDFPLRPSKAALLIIDVQTYLTTTPDKSSDDYNTYFWDDAVPKMIRNLQQLIQAFRSVRDNDSVGKNGGSEVIFSYLQAATKDGRDISLDYKLSGPQLSGIPRVHELTESLFLEKLKPDIDTGKGDILVPKTSCSVFQSTNIDYLLRNLGIEQLVITGQLTDQCVESAVRDAADLGYFVTVVEDACAATSSASHMKGLMSMKGFCRIMSTEMVMNEMIHAGDERKQRDEGSNDGKQMTQADILSFLEENGFGSAATALASMFEQK